MKHVIYHDKSGAQKQTYPTNAHVRLCYINIASGNTTFR